MDGIGSRPEFKGVTGVSTGALIAPFAFLGPRYDGSLEKFYTTISQKDVFKSRGMIKGVTSDAMADTTPLAKLIAQNTDQALLDAIAVEYAKGRILLVGTANLDSLEPVIWNMTAIAASKSANSLQLFRTVLLASASIPGAFPPVMIDVTSTARFRNACRRRRHGAGLRLPRRQSTHASGGADSGRPELESRGLTGDGAAHGPSSASETRRRRDRTQSPDRSPRRRASGISIEFSRPRSETASSSTSPTSRRPSGRTRTRSSTMGTCASSSRSERMLLREATPGRSPRPDSNGR
jgi:hypothetical protein